MEINRERALELLNKAVEEKGAEYVNDPHVCSYYQFEGSRFRPLLREDGRAAPSCIVGNVFYQLGFDPYKIYPGVFVNMSVDSDGNMLERSSVIEDAFMRDSAGDKVRLTTGAIALLDAAQGEQDAGTPWGEAVAEAEARTRGIA